MRNNKKFLCPMKFSSVTDNGYESWFGHYCDKDKCAWWFSVNKCCSIPATAKALNKEG